MPIINVRHTGNNRSKKKTKKTKQKKQKQRQKEEKKKRSGASYNENVRGKWFRCAFKLGFVESICKASLIFKSNLESALLIISRERII